MTTPILIQAVPGSSIFFGDPKAFSEAYVVVERRLLFSTKSVKDFRVVPIHGLVTVLFVRTNARMGPFLSHEGLFVLLRSGREFASCHSDVFRLGVAWALLAVDPFFLLGIDFGFVWAA